MRQKETLRPSISTKLRGRIKRLFKRVKSKSMTCARLSSSKDMLRRSRKTEPISSKKQPILLLISLKTSDRRMRS